MKLLIILAVFLSGSVAFGGDWNYPPTRTVDVSDTYFGVTYRDPYRWLENLKDPEVMAWFNAQALLTDGILSKIPGRDALVREWMALDKLRPESYSSITYENGRVFYMKTLGGENVGKLYFRDGWSGAEKLLFDPAIYSTDVVTTIGSFDPSFDGRYVLLALTSGGAEFSEIRVLDADDGKLLPESIYPSYGPISWTLDSRSFLYDAGKVTDIKNPEIELNRKTRLHRLSTDTNSDADFFSDESYPDLGIAPNEFPSAYLDESYPYYIFGGLGTVQSEMRIFYAPVSEMTNSKIEWKVLCKPSDNLVRGMEFYGDYVYAVTHTDAPKFKLVRTSVKHPDWGHAETVLPEADDSIQYIAKSRNFLFIVYSNGIISRIVKYSPSDGRSSEVTLPFTGTANIRCPDWHTDRCILSITSWTRPTTLFDYDAEKDTLQRSIFNTEVIYPGFEDLTSEEVEAPGYDGVMVPLSIIYKKGIKLDGGNCCILEGYGAYGYSLTPYFSILHSVALRGVVLAYAHTRGGGEKGDAWYRAGYRTTKPNTWKDFISCAEYLVRKGFTSPLKLSGTGTSAGGILISRAITDRPDLFGAAVCNVGCANAMRMEFSPNGPANIPEFGSVKDPAECQALYEMDGVMHVVLGAKYPAVLCVAGWNDPRVPPWQPGKFAAALQNASASERPVLMKVNYKSGHFSEEKMVTIKDFADQFSFMLWQTGHIDFQPSP
jgi:prolyl oligopeptidase